MYKLGIYFKSKKIAPRFRLFYVKTSYETFIFRIVGKNI